MSTLRKIMLLLVTLPLMASADIPSSAWQYRTDMLKSAWRTFGPGAPVAVLGAQIHQESAWKIDARSWAGAEGLAQFMPGTAKDMAKRFPSECAPANPFSPKWAFACRDRYLKGLIRASENERTTDCDDWAFGLRAYNGGGTRIRRDRNLTFERGCDGDNWRQVSKFNAGRGEAAFKENTEYPERIFKLTPDYLEWGAGMECI